MCILNKKIWHWTALNQNKWDCNETRNNSNRARHMCEYES